MTAMKETPPPRFVIGHRNLDELTLPPKLSCAPSSVTVANQEAIDKIEQARTAARELRAARDEAKRAPALDAAADKSAAALGLPLPEHGAGAAAREAMRDCARRAEAQDGAAHDAVTVLVRAISKHRGQWMKEERATIQVAEAECRDLLGQFTVAFTALQTERHILRVLEAFPSQGSLHSTRLSMPVQTTPAAIAELAALIDPKEEGNTLRPAGRLTKRVLGQP